MVRKLLVHKVRSGAETCCPLEEFQSVPKMSSADVAHNTELTVHAYDIGLALIDKLLAVGSFPLGADLEKILKHYEPFP